MIYYSNEGALGSYFCVVNNTSYQDYYAEGMEMRTRITLACTECKNRNYDTKKDKKLHPDRMETKKYCRFCKRHTLHKETK